MKYWKLMAGRGAEQLEEFLQESKIRIGFVSDKRALEAKSLDKVKALVRTARPEATKAQVASHASQLNKFLNDIEVGDRVLVYEFSTRLYHVGVVISDAAYEECDALPYSRTVEWKHTISRDDLSVSTRNTLGSILTLFSVNEDAQKEIEAILDGQHVAESEEIEGEEIATEREDVAARAKEFTKDKLQNLSWEDMQELVAGLLRAMGYRTTVSPPGADRGKDIIASPDGLGLEEPRIHVEVKHRKGQMGAQEIRSFVGGLRKTKGLYVSTGGFTKEAQYEAERSENPITLMDIDVLARMVVKHYDSFDTEARALLPLKKIYWPL